MDLAGKCHPSLRRPSFPPRDVRRSVRRVTSRPRLVSWDAFDATTPPTPHSASSSVSSTFSTQSVSSRRSRGSRKRRSKMDRRRRVSPNASKNANGNASSSSSNSAKNNIGQVQGLPEDVLLAVASFCTVDDIRHVSQTSHCLRALILSDAAEQLWKDIVQRTFHLPAWLIMIKNKKYESTILVDALDTPTPCADGFSINLPLLVGALAAPHMPTRVDETLFAHPHRWSFRRTAHHSRRAAVNQQQAHARSELQVVPLQGSQASAEGAVRFLGRIGQGDRCIRADQPLPRPKVLKPPQPKNVLQKLWRLDPNHSTKKQPRLKPFVAPFCQGNYIHLTPRTVSYFEVEILGPECVDEKAAAAAASKVEEDEQESFSLRLPEPDVRRASPTTSSSECVAIGIGTDDFGLYARMPGWDTDSYGYHGDDGGLFHGSGHQLRTYGPTFGAGDVVGCGIDYTSDGKHADVFFTLNGKHLGNIDMLDPHRDYYPIVGLDTSNLIRCNFVDFQYDLAQHILQKELGDR